MKIVSDTQIFIDTNILYYANDPNASFGDQAIKRIQELAAANNELFISTQIIREYAHVTLRNALYHNLDLQASIESVLNNISIFQRDFTVIYDSPKILTDWKSLLLSLTTYKDVFDFNIASTLRTNGINHLLTHNEKDFEKFSDWLTVIPLFSTTT